MTDAAIELVQARRTIEEGLDRWLPSASEEPARLHEAMRYAVLGGGKRLRPLLCLAAARATGGSTEAALPAACAVEMIHAYSLVHDDLPAMDDDDLRRGRPTVHRAYDEALAILVGDALQSRAVELLAREPAGAPEGRRLRILAEVVGAAGTRGMIGGQVDDLAAEGRPPDPETVSSIHRRKTGALLRASVRAGGLAAGADAATLDALGRYGDAVGLAFQIVDDVLDTTAGSDVLGKTAGKDAAAGKATFVALLGAEAARQRAGRLRDEALDALGPLRARAELLEELARRAVERSR